MSAIKVLKPFKTGFISKCPSVCPMSGFLSQMSGFVFIINVRICVHDKCPDLYSPYSNMFDPRSGSLRRVEKKIVLTFAIYIPQNTFMNLYWLRVTHFSTHFSNNRQMTNVISLHLRIFLERQRLKKVGYLSLIWPFKEVDRKFCEAV